ncbi:polysaccharide lyase family 7 protein [Pseudonocardia sp. TRM90224]|uniref:polysaccharide lyase family 7 protein n=1 Tax=Pseudonocardia sp. TRM90224 TaxID=2812678 RepID=UPI001E34C8B2|nr:polysaccharide lyase family 7 protein [Pseudonocardia sp. TRM90224]
MRSPTRTATTIGASIAIAATLTTFPSQHALAAGPSASPNAAPDALCPWYPSAVALAGKLDRQDDARALRLRDGLEKLQITPDADPPTACAAASPPAAAHGVLGKGSATLEMGIDTTSTRTGRTLAVGAGEYPSIQAAADVAQPGDTVEIAGGDYASFVPANGVAGAWVTYQARAGEKVTISSGGGEQGLLLLDGPQFIKVIGVAVTGSESHGIYASGADHVVLQDCEVADSRNGGIVFLDSSHIIVDGCNVHGNNTDGTSASHEAISITGTDTVEILNNQVHDNGEEGIDAKYGDRNGAIHHNQVWGNRGPNIYLDSVTDVTVHDNDVWGSTEPSKAGIGLAVEDLAEARRTSNITIARNRIRNNAGAGIDFWTESSGSFSNITVTDNEIGGNDRGGITFTAGDFSSSTIAGNAFGEGNSPPEDAPSGVDIISNVATALHYLSMPPTTESAPRRDPSPPSSPPSGRVGEPIPRREPASTAPTAPSPSRSPGEVLDLANWSLTLPSGSAGDPVDILQPDLNRYSDDAFHVTDAGDGVVFTATAGGVTTENSAYPRSELREMTRTGMTSTEKGGTEKAGTEKAAWSSAAGTHTLTVRQAITQTPQVKPHVVSAQIHDGNDDVVAVRLEGARLFAEYDNGAGEVLLDPAYLLGTPFDLQIVAAQGGVWITYNGTSKAEIPLSGEGWYFKTGSYVQSNIDKGEAPRAAGQVIIYALSVIHSGDAYSPATAGL